MQRTQARLVEIDAEHAERRIDNFLRTEWKDVPRSVIYRKLRKGEVRVNGGRIGADYRLKVGDSVRVPPLFLEQAADRPAARPIRAPNLPILFEDDRLLVIDKPAGLAVHGGSGLTFGAIEALRALRPDASYLELVHRLDRETSGCLMIAKRRSMLRRLQDALRAHALTKRYTCLVAGTPRARRLEAKQPLVKNTLRSGERVVRVASPGDPRAKEARSVFRRSSGADGYTLLEAEPITGRTHQLRVHAVALGYPILGDAKYATDESARAAKAIGLKRLFLHAHQLRIPAPADKDAPLVVEAPLPAELASVLARLGIDDPTRKP